MVMIDRNIAPVIRSVKGKMPVISITGPRQSGKTTLARKVFADYRYFNLEDMENRTFAISDPKGFLLNAGPRVVLDEIQHVPDLFSQIQVMTDELREKVSYVITGSQNFLLLEKISQTLAGRVAVFHLLPFSYQELQKASNDPPVLYDLIVKGGYPPIYDRDLDPSMWLNSYILTYIERDVRQIINIKDLSAFQNFLRMCAGRTGQLLNYSSLANDLSVSYHTVQNWLSILEASFIVFRLQPFYENYNKRLIKAPKLYFYDTGLACTLLGIKTREQLSSHYLKGELFESFVMSELFKHAHNMGIRPSFYYWKNNAGQEVDCIYEDGAVRKAIEMKSGMTIHPDFFRSLHYWTHLTNGKPENSYLVYGGDQDQKRTVAHVLSWRNTNQLFTR